MIVTKENVSQCCSNKNGVFFIRNRQHKLPSVIISSNETTEEKILSIINNNDTLRVKFYEKNDPFVIKYSIGQFIKEHWNPYFTYRNLPDGKTLVEFNILGDITQKELIDGVLFNLSILRNILPGEAATRFLRISASIPPLIKLQFDEGVIKGKLTPENQVDFMNEVLKKKLQEYNSQYSDCHTACDYFINSLCSNKPIQNWRNEIQYLVYSTWHPFVYPNPNTKKFETSWVVGNIIGELVFILNISHDEATDLFNKANQAVNNIYTFDADAHYIKQVTDKGQTNYGVQQLQADFEYNMAFHLLMKESSKNKDISIATDILSPTKNPLTKAFLNEIITNTLHRK